MQTVNISNISAGTCSGNQFRMSENEIQVKGSIYNFCADENKVSTSTNNSSTNKIQNIKLSETKSYTPIPIQINTNNILN